MSVQKRGVSLSDSTFHMNEGSSFRSLNTEISGDNSVGAIGPIFDPSAQQVGSKDSHTAGSEHSFGRHCTRYSKLNSYPRWQKGQVRQEALWRRYSGAPETGNSRNHGDQVRQFSASMVYTLSAPHQLRPYSGERENGD